jgi:arylsulfatase A-like enzyme
MGTEHRKRNATFACCLCAIAAPFASAANPARPNPDPPTDRPDAPNILVILADDLGWGDLACYGQPRIKTPALDRLAEAGILFTQFYVNSPVCSPTRAAMMTGRFPAELAIHGALGSKEKNRSYGRPDHLDPAYPTLPRALRAAGYATGHFGKWHLAGSKDGPLPSRYGFDTFYVLAHEKNPETRVVRYYENDNAAGWNLTPPDFKAHSTERIVKTIDFITNADRPRPFYAQVWLQDVHARLQPTDEQMKPYARLYGTQRIYYAAVTNMDRHIGRLLTTLDDAGLADRTLVLFTSDNGPEDIAVRNAAEHAIGSAGPFRGRKRSLYEGGIRMPFIVRWPGHAPAGRVDNDSIISGVDFFPTFCAAAGAALQAAVRETLDGENVLPAFRGNPITRHKPLLWEYRFRNPSHVIHVSPTLAIRAANWKLLLNPDRSRIELYDIPNDPTELNNRADEHPDIVRRLARQLLAWHADLPPGPTFEEAGRTTYPWPKEKPQPTTDR